MKDVFICDAVRTPFGKYKGALSAIRTDDLSGDSYSNSFPKLICYR